MENSLHYTSVNHAYHLIGAINELRKRHELCDIILKCGRTLIPAHKLILSVSTPYFKNLVENQYKSDIRELKIDDVDGTAVQIIVEFFYTSAVSVDDVTVWTLLPAASLLQVEEIQNLCCDFLSSQLQLENCLRIHGLATKCLCSGLLKESTEFVKTNFDEIIDEEIFLEMSLKEVIGHLKRLNGMGIEDAKILQAVKCWVMHSVDDRQTMGYMLLQEFSNLKEELEKFIPSEYQVPQEQGMKRWDLEEEDEFNQKLDRPSYEFIEVKQESLSDPEFSNQCNSSDSFHDNEEGNDLIMNMIQTGTSDLDKSAEECAENYLSIREKGSFQLFSGGSSDSSPVSRRGKDDGYRLKYECDWPGCPKKFFSKTGLKFHTNKHKNVFPYNCNKCSKGFNRSCEYEDHMNGHAGNYWKCSICGAILRSQHGRRVHESQHSNQQLPCDICGKIFPCRDYLNSHLRAHKNSFECHICKKIFKRKHHYKEHIKVHEQDGFHCNLCDFVTNYSQSLKRHIRNSHDPEKIELQTCKNCGKTFNRHDFLMKHIEKCQESLNFDDSEQMYLNDGILSDMAQPEFPQFVKSEPVLGSQPVDENMV